MYFIYVVWQPRLVFRTACDATTLVAKANVINSLMPPTDGKLYVSNVVCINTLLFYLCENCKLFSPLSSFCFFACPTRMLDACGSSV